jgi:hypothetical protein
MDTSVPVIKSFTSFRGSSIKSGAMSFTQSLLIIPADPTLAIVAVVCSVLGLLLGSAAGAFAVYCCVHHRKPRPPLPVAPVYDDVDITTTRRHTQPELKLEENVAYGHFNK